MTKNKDTKALIQEAIRELLNDEEFVNKIVNKVADRLETIEKSLIKTVNTVKQLENKIVNIQQNEKINNICLYNLEETNDEKLREGVLEILNNRVKIPTKKEDIARCYRVGNKVPGKIRPIIIKFQCYIHKVRVLKNAFNLKGTKMGLSEELVKGRLEIYKKAVEKFSKRDVFTRSGSIFVKYGNSNHRITSIDDLENLADDENIVSF